MLTAKKAVAVLPGGKYGRWTVLNDFETTTKGEKKWLCRCDCGTERYVLERSLRHGGSLSCGCLRKEALSEVISHDLGGQSFGELTVLQRSETYHKNGGVWWLCKCRCGNTVEYPGTLLVTGRRTSCGCKTVKHYHSSDITGKVFGRLTALYPTDERDSRGSIVWHCRCSCGNEIDVTYNSLVYTNQRSCGCMKHEHDQKLGSYLVHIDGTSLDAISSKKIPSDNTTGYKGVYLIKGKYVAKIVFKGKAYYLGTYQKVEDAAAARQKAENELFGSTIEFHARWQKKAESDSVWAEKNPIQIFVEAVKGSLRVSFLPEW